MDDLWRDDAAEAMVAAHGDRGERIHSARRLGADPRLVPHGGGNIAAAPR